MFISLLSCPHQELRDQADAKSHVANLECDRLHILLTDFKARAELQANTASTIEKELRDKIETLHEDVQALRVAALTASAATTEEVTRGHELRQNLINDLATKDARVAELEHENRDLMEGTIQQDRLLNAAVNDSIDLGHRVLEGDISLASIHEKQKHEMNKSMEVQADNILSSAEDVERKVTEKFFNDTEDLQFKLQELDKANKLLEFEKTEFLEDMKSTIETVGHMESRLNTLIDENIALRAEISAAKQRKDPLIQSTEMEPEKSDVSLVFPESSLQNIASLVPRASHASPVATGELTSPDKTLLKISSHTRPRGQGFTPPVVGRLERLETFIDTLQIRQETPPATPNKQVIFNIEALLRCLLSIKQESEEMVVHTSTVATTSLLRQLRHRKSHLDKRSSSSAVTSPPGGHAPRTPDTRLSPAVGLSGVSQHQPPLPTSGSSSPRFQQYPGEVELHAPQSDSDADSDYDVYVDEEDIFAETVKNKKSLERQGSERSFNMFHRMDSSGDGFISLPEFIKAVRKYSTIGKVLSLSLSHYVLFIFCLWCWYVLVFTDSICCCLMFDVCCLVG